MSTLLGFLVALGIVLPGSASALTITLDSVANGDTPASASPYLTADFTTVAPGTVTLTLTSSLDVASEHVHEVGFNIDPVIAPSAISVVQGIGPTGTVFNTTQDAQIIQGTGVTGFGLDFVITFPTVPPEARFNDSLVATFTLTAAGITDSSFNFVNLNDGFVFGAHLHGIACTPTSSSADCFPGGVFDPNATTSGFVVPEPATAAMLALGLIGLGSAGRRRRA